MVPVLFSEFTWKNISPVMIVYIAPNLIKMFYQCRQFIVTVLEKCLYSEFFWSVFSPNAGKYRPGKLRIRTLFTQFESNVCEGAQKNLAVIDFSINQRCKVDTGNQMIRDYSPQPTCDSGYLQFLDLFQIWLL